jgi:hypothetical protein
VAQNIKVVLQAQPGAEERSDEAYTILLSAGFAFEEFKKELVV